MTTVDTPIPDTLRDAALYIERHGWRQGDMYERRVEHGRLVAFPPVCAMGAIVMASCGTSLPAPFVLANTWPAMRVLGEYLCPDRGIDMADSDLRDEVGSWNDDDDQTAAGVIRTLRAAADDYEQAHTAGS
jgi:hypothetical protein